MGVRRKEKVPDYVFPPIIETPQSLDKFLKNVNLIKSQIHRVCKGCFRFSLNEFRGYNNIRYCAFCGRIYIESDNNSNIDVEEYVEYRKRILSGDFDNM